MRRAIISMNIGNNPMYRPCLTSQLEYANRHGHTYYLIQESRINTYNFYFEKLQAAWLLDQGFDQVLYIDGDVLVTPDAPDIFASHGDPTAFYAHHESEDSEVMDRDKYVEPLLESAPGWPKQPNGKYQYFNAGIMLFGKESAPKLLEGIQTPPNIPALWEFGDQTFLNYLAAKNEVNFQSLPREFNWMNCGENDPDCNRYKAHFIHYAGPCLYGDGNKAEVMLRDYKELYEDN